MHFISRLFMKLSKTYKQSIKTAKPLIKDIKLISKFIIKNIDTIIDEIRTTVLIFLEEKNILQNIVGHEHSLDKKERNNNKILNSVAVFTTFSVMVSAFLITQFYTLAFQVTVNGREAGYVSDYSQYETVLENVENDISKVINEPFYIKSTPIFKFKIVRKDEFNYEPTVDRGKLYQSLYATSGSTLAYGYGLYVDGEHVLSAFNKYDIDTALSMYMSEKRGIGSDTKAEFLNNIEIKDQLFMRDTLLQDSSDVLSVIRKPVIKDQVYEVNKDETLSTVAANLNVSENEISDKNRALSAEPLQAGLKLAVSETQPLLTVQVIKEIVYNEVIPYKTVTTKSEDYYTNVKKLVTTGKKGQSQITAQIIMVDGVEIERKVVNTKVVKTPVEEKIVQGTKKMPKTAPTGTMGRPISLLRVSSSYGYRGHEFHTGVDWVAAKGTKVLAADGGKVIFAGWKGNYGYLVIIDHGNGLKTYYAHNSSLVVEAGTSVYKGQHIANSGSTGRSTGSHVHFEVRKNGDAVNPTKYVK